MQSLEIALLAMFEKLGDQSRDREESHPIALHAGRMSQGRCQVRLACARVADDQDVFPPGKILPARQFAHRGFVDGGLGGEVKAVECLEDRKLRVAQPAVGGSLLSIHEFALGQLEQEVVVAGTLLGAEARHGLVFAQDRRQLERLEVVLEQHGCFVLAHRAPPSNWA